MSLLAFDLGGTKLAMAVFNETGEILFHKIVVLKKEKAVKWRN